MRYLVTGGGTGGHIYPALAIAMELKKRDEDAEILYVGTEEGLESKLVPKEGFAFETIRVKGMPRKLNKESFIAAKELMHGLSDSKKILKNYKPDIVIGTGGYVCGPVVYKAARMNIPTVIHEQNAFPGITNKILSRFVDKILITFEEARKHFKNRDNIFLTGNPIRSTIFDVDRNEVFDRYNFNRENPILLSFGGSGGQKKLNDSLEYFIKNNLDTDIQIVHVTGDRFYAEFMEKLDEDGINLPENIKVLPYVYDMPELLNITDLIITSAGAITLAEISALGIPSILIPKGYTAENHQEHNANSFKNNGASIVILEKDLTGEQLDKIILDTINDKDKLKDMSERASEMGIKDAVGNIVNIINGLTS